MSDVVKIIYAGVGQRDVRLSIAAEAAGQTFHLKVFGYESLESGNSGNGALYLYNQLSLLIDRDQTISKEKGAELQRILHRDFMYGFSGLQAFLLEKAPPKHSYFAPNLKTGNKLYALDHFLGVLLHAGYFGEREVVAVEAPKSSTLEAWGEW